MAVVDVVSCPHDPRTHGGELALRTRPTSALAAAMGSLLARARRPGAGIAEPLLRAVLRGYVRASGVRCRVVNSAEEQARVNAFRRRVFAGAGYPEGLAARTERYDPHSIGVAAYAGDALVGALRLIHAGRSCRVLDLWNVALPPEVRPAQIHELSGLAIDGSRRGRGRAALLGLLDVALEVARAQDVRWWIVSAQPRTFRSFLRINERCTILTPEPPTERHLAHRRDFDEYLRSHGATITIGLFDLSAVSYVQNLTGSLRGRLRGRLGGVTRGG
ncbi:MAG: hypothetical protein R3B09_33340 [Nannocystaceae bacterium]